MKQCFKCKKEKPLSDFYKHPQMKDGRVNKCKECNKLDVRKNRSKKLDYYRAYDRERGNRHKPGYLKQYRRDNPIKYGAQTMVANALRSGKLTKAESCESCDETTALHGHHNDYAKPLEVTWLCPGCHHAWHAKNGQALNG